MKEEKQKAIDLALSKLTEEEKELLGLIKKPKVNRVKKNYKLKIFYMIGDADGHTDEEATISVNNPFLPIVTKALDNLKVPDGSWGLRLSYEHYDKNFEAKNINELEYDILTLVTNYNYENDEHCDEILEKHNFESSGINIDFLYEFEGIFTDETEYSFLVYEKYKLK